MHTALTTTHRANPLPINAAEPNASPASPPIIIASKAERHPIYGTTPVGRDGCTLQGQMLATLNAWHEKASNLSRSATDKSERALGSTVADEIFEVSMQTKPVNRREAVAQFEILARIAFVTGRINVISADRLMVLVEGLKKVNEPAGPKKLPGKLQRGRKLTRAGLLVRYESFLAQELETISWHLYGDKNVSFGRVMYDRAITVRCAPNRRSGPFLGETKLPARARSVLKSLKIDTERNDEVPARIPGG